MVTVKQASDYIKKKFPQFVITSCRDWNGGYYFVLGKKNMKPGDFIDMGQRVDKKTGDVTHFSFSDIGPDRLEEYMNAKQINV